LVLKIIRAEIKIIQHKKKKEGGRKRGKRVEKKEKGEGEDWGRSKEREIILKNWRWQEEIRKEAGSIYLTGD
jgi:hypothetical protein